MPATIGANVAITFANVSAYHGGSRATNGDAACTRPSAGGDPNRHCRKQKPPHRAQTATGLKKGCSSTMINSQADFLPAHHRDAPVRCPVCEKRVQRQARQQTYCSRKCRQRAHYDKSVAEGRFDPLLGKDTGLPTNPPQKSRNFSALQTTKTGSSLRIYGPARVIERELFAGRDWRVVTSADGVVCHVASPLETFATGFS